MNISKTIKEQRNRLSISQDELGERIYVTRQTISNWENDKTYPDINSLILLSQVFDMTIDSLIKGDLEIMEQKIEANDIRALNRYSNLMAIGMILVIIIIPISFYLRLVPGFAIAALVFATTLYFAYKAEQIKKQYDVQTYREIIAFTKGETLDEIAKLRESGKRKYQTFLHLIGMVIVASIISGIIWWILRIL